MAVSELSGTIYRGEESVSHRVIADHILSPVAKSLVIVFVNGHIQTLWLEGQILARGQEFPAPHNRFLFEIIPKTKVPQHLKQRVMAVGTPHILDVADSHTFLAGGHTVMNAFVAETGGAAHEIRFELLHPRHAKHQGGVWGNNAV